MISVYDYFDYREFLIAKIGRAQRLHPYFSLRFISKEIDLSSSFFVKVLNGSRNISSRHAMRLGRLLGLKSNEINHFLLLIKYNQAKGHENKKKLFEKVLPKSGPRVRKLSKKQHAYYSHWYYAVVREIVDKCQNQKNPQKIGRLLLPSIPTLKAKEAVKLLLDLKMLKKDASGKLKQVAPFIEPGQEVPIVSIHSFQIEMMNRAKEALQKIPKDEREISTLTVGLSKGTYDKIRKRIEAFRHEIVNMAAHEKNISRVYQINFQAFPVSEEYDTKANS